MALQNESNISLQQFIYWPKTASDKGSHCAVIAFIWTLGSLCLISLVDTFKPRELTIFSIISLSLSNKGKKIFVIDYLSYDTRYFKMLLKVWNHSLWHINKGNFNLFLLKMFCQFKEISIFQLQWPSFMEGRLSDIFLKSGPSINYQLSYVL